MGKKLKPKAGRNARKTPARAPSDSGDRSVGVTDGAAKPEEGCNHYSKDRSYLNRILLAIQSSLNVAAACEHCREEPVTKRGNKEKGNKNKKKGGAKDGDAKSESNFIWVCLDCNRCFCGGAVNVSVPYGHVRRHAKQDHHPWVVRLDDPLVSWCFMCNSSVQIELPEVLNAEVAKSDVEECSASNSGPMENGEEKGFAIRGLVNLGNTCFFNSVMQNIFALNVLRDYFVSLGRPFGPLSTVLKKLFLETSMAADSRGVLNLKALFGCICTKAPQFRGYQQQDSHELLRYLLDGLHMEEVSEKKLADASDEKDKGDSFSEASFVDAIFGGLLSSTVSCVDCGHTSTVHEPFLDLSLPVPSKKCPPKKVPLPNNKNKPPPREGNKSRRFREKAPTVSEQPKAENLSSSECSVSGAPAPHEEPEVTYGGESDFAWMDYLEPNVTADAADSVCEEGEIYVAQCSDGVNMRQKEVLAECSDSATEMCSEEVMVPSESCADSSHAVETLPSFQQNPGVILLPYKEIEATAEETNREASCSLKPENFNCVDNLAKETSIQSTSVAGCEQTEEVFDGLGDLFNEPEVTSDLRTETGMDEDVEMTFGTGNSSESNQDEIDNSDSPVSVISCLALFTKPEILSDEHAWHCEHCSESLQGQKVVRNNCKRRAVASLAEPSKSQVNRAQVSNKRTSSSGEANCLDPAERHALDNGKVTSTSEDAVSHHERLEPNINVNATTEPHYLVAGSDSLTCKFVKAENEKSLVLLDPASDDQAQCPDVTMNDEGLNKSGHVSNYTSHAFAREKVTLYSGYHENGSCSINDSNCVKCDGHDIATVSSSSTEHTQTAMQSACENDHFGEVDQTAKKSAQSMVEKCSEDGSRDDDVKHESKKVKRDATKRFMIHRCPQILTIHLKRFSQDARGRLSKLRGHIPFQETLDLKPYMDPRSDKTEKCSYRLVGVVEHSGGMSGGHYVAYVRGERSKGKDLKSSGPAWYYASDAFVRGVSLNEVLQSDAYILFYERVEN
ncbi:Ubiquitinyl hydrolase 1 protein [Dioscorea alata]|uniref:Ubiquitinyl hydrolase 1 protein n=2 Tax=Dioscorea alata TaxID=55571 RepID=A0ACB7UU25_DIOAL|nr:Ubiquitinyl hydrolase 1 protein [Dioscorea alata]KAH7664143.1 Ubiquitinyl hydrolase 1 protein [Dioscorea alata]